MPLLNDALKAMIGVESEVDVACDCVEAGAVRRFSHACMDIDPSYYDAEFDGRLGGAVAPPLYALNMFRRPFDAPDVLQAHADDPDFDGATGAVTHGLPRLPLKGMVLLNGGAEIELFRYLRHGERVFSKSKYLDIIEKSGSRGPFLVVLVETLYFGANSDPVLRIVKTLLRRPA